MVRGGLVLAVGVAALVAVWVLNDATDDPGPADAVSFEDAPGVVPVLEGDARPAPPPLTAGNVGDPVAYVSTLGGEWEEATIARVAALGSDPDFLAALIAFVKHPEHPELPAGMSSSAPRWREAAVKRALAAIGAPAAAALAPELSDADVDVRIRVAQAIQAIGPKAERAVPTLLARLDVEESKYAKAATMDALGAIGEAARDALPWIHKTLKDEDAEERFGLACARALVPIGGVSPDNLGVVRWVLQADWYQASAAVIKSLAPLGRDAEPLIPTLLTLYDTTLGEDQLWGLVPPALAAIGVASDDVIAFLRRTYWTTVEQQLWGDHVLRALARLGPRGQQELLAITASGETPHDRLDAVRELQQVGVDRAELLRLLEAPLRDGYAEQQTAVLGVMAELGVPADRLPWIEPFLEAEHSEMRAAAILALGSVENAPAKVFDLLEKRLDDDDPHNQTVAVNAIARLSAADPKRALGLLKRAAAAPVAWTRQTAVLAFETLLERFPAEASAAWRAALDDADLRFDAASALARLAPPTSENVTALLGMLGHDDARLRGEGVRGLVRFGRQSHLDAVLEASHDEAPHVRAAAIAGLHAFLRHDRRRVIDRWIDALDDRQPIVQWHACSQLADVGAEAKDAIPRLEELAAVKQNSRYMSHLASAPKRALDAIRAALGE